MKPTKRPSVTITNSRASRLPSQRGDFARDPESVAPITPALVPRHRQLAPAPNVVVTSRRASRV